MYLLTLIYYCLALWLAGVVCLIVSTIILNRCAYSKFKKNSKGLPIAGQYSWLCSHTNSVLFKRHLMHDIESLMRKSGGKMFALMFGQQPMIYTHDLDLIKRVLIDEKSINRIPLRVPIKEVEIDNILLCQDNQWRRIRRVIAPALRGNNLFAANVQTEIDDSTSRVIQAIETELDRSKSGQIELNMDDLLHRYSLNLVLSCFYKQNKSVSFDLNKPDTMTQIVDRGLEAVMWNPIVRLNYIFPVFTPLVDWLALNFTQQGVWRKWLLKLIAQQTKLNLDARKQIQKSKARGEQVDENNFMLDSGVKFSRNMVDHIIDQYHDGKLTKQEYFHSSFFLLNAADKTASDSLVHTIYQLAIHEDIQDRLRQSVRAYGTESEYLSWVIDESLRLLPPAALGCPRMVERDLGTEHGYVIPAKSYLVTPAYSIHRLPEYWGPDAEEFKPERFAKTDHFHPFQYIPFGAGPRMCPGKEFALLQMKKLLCALLIRYKFRCEPMENLYDSPFFVYLLPDKHTHVKISRLN